MYIEGRKSFMGQRLNIEIVRKDKVIATSYYHWSAYTVPAVEMTFTALRELIKNKNVVDDVDMAVRALEATGAGLTEEDKSSITNGQDYKISQNRNDGFIGVTQESMQNMINYQEGDTAIIINKDGYDFNVEDTENDNIHIDICGMLYFLSPDDLKDEYNMDEKDLRTIPVHIENITFNEMRILLDKISDPDGKYDIFKDATGQIFATIG
jgi:hypothetical protein